jgi:hypothetical protein
MAADLDWLKRQGVAVERYNLAQQAHAFATNPVVTAELKKHGNDCLPLVLVDGEIASRSTYPSREELARLAGVASGGQAASPEAAACCESTAFPWEACCSTEPSTGRAKDPKCC